jgi:hypothetical protein
MDAGFIERGNDLRMYSELGETGGLAAVGCLARGLGGRRWSLFWLRL